MEVVTGALPSVITKLGELLIGEYNPQRGVKGDSRFRPSVLHPTKMISADICEGKEEHQSKKMPSSTKEKEEDSSC